MSSDPEPIHVLHVTAAAAGGVLRHVLELSEGCLNAGFRVTLGFPRHRVSERHSLDELARLERRGLVIDSFGLEPSIRPLSYLGAAVRVRRYIHRGGVDLVHIHSSRAGALLRLLPTVPRRSCRVLYTPHAFSFLMPRVWLGRRLYVYLERLAARLRTDALVAVSASEGRLAVREGIARNGRLRVIGNGVSEPEPMENGERARGSLERITVISVGRLCRQKNPLLFVDVAEKLCNLRSDIEFRWVGGGEVGDRVRARLARSRHGERILFLGHVDDVDSELRRANIYFSTSLYEGLPYAALDAMARGLPMVVSDVVGNRDLVSGQKNGRLFDSGSVDSAVDALLAVITSPGQLAGLGRESLRVAREEHSLETMIRSYIELYQELAAEIDRPPDHRPRKRPIRS